MHACWRVCCGPLPCRLQSTPNLLVVWRPDLHTYTASLLSKVNGSAKVNAKMNNADLPKIVGQGLGKAIQLWQEDVHVSVPRSWLLTTRPSLQPQQQCRLDCPHNAPACFSCAVPACFQRCACLLAHRALNG